MVLLELHALTLAARSYALLATHTTHEYFSSVDKVVVCSEHPESIIDIGLRLRPVRQTYSVLCQVGR